MEKKTYVCKDCGQAMTADKDDIVIGKIKLETKTLCYYFHRKCAKKVEKDILIEKAKVVNKEVFVDYVFDGTVVNKDDTINN